MSSLLRGGSNFSNVVKGYAEPKGYSKTMVVFSFATLNSIKKDMPERGQGSG